VHSTAGIVKPGWRGHLVLELSKAGRNTVLLKPGMQIGYLTFRYLKTPTDKPYSGRYQDQNDIEVKGKSKQEKII
jgi:dCTP deaminase